MGLSEAIVRIVFGVAAIGASGCYATLSGEPGPVTAFGDQEFIVRATRVPADIWAYPHVRWGRNYAYLVEGRWYYPTSGGWVVYRQEPVELARQRTLIESAPRVRPYERTPEYGYPAPPPPAPPPPPPDDYDRYRNERPYRRYSP